MTKQSHQKNSMQYWVDEFEALSDAILVSKSPKHYKEILEFLRKTLLSDQIYFWKTKKNIAEKTRSRQPQRQKFLSLVKTSLEEFDIYQKEFESVNFKAAWSHIDKNKIYLKLPMSGGDRNFNFIIQTTESELFKDQDIKYFFEKRLSGLLNLIEKLDAVQSLSFEDDVTGLYNQRYLNILLDQEIERFKRSNISFSVLFIDVDHFKMVNDKNGHMVGSQVLKEIGEILKKSVRAVDFCFRYGGDEFLMVLTSTSTEQATIVAERVCKQVRETPFVVAGKKVNVTLSIGVATFPDHAQTKEKILQVADEAMYCGKNLSRNVVYLAS